MRLQDFVGCFSLFDCFDLAVQVIWLVKDSPVAMEAFQVPQSVFLGELEDMNLWRHLGYVFYSEELRL